MFRSSSPVYPPSSSPASSPPPTTGNATPFASSSKLPSTAPTTPPPEESEDGDIEEELTDEDKEKWGKLEPFLQRVTLYAKVLKDQMDKVSVEQKQAVVTEINPRPKPQSKVIPKGSFPKFETTAKPTSSRKPRSSIGGLKGKKRARVEEDDDETDTAKRLKVEESQEDSPSEVQEDNAEEDSQFFTQPALITGAKLKKYQLEGVAWMAGLYQNGISGILADEMGLGKTLQTIAFHAYIRERSPSPFLVVCPLSVLDNWAREFAKFAPDIPVCVYHGSPEERADLRKNVMVLPEVDKRKWWIGMQASCPTGKASRGRGRPPKQGGAFKSRQRATTVTEVDEDSERPDLPPHMRTTFPVIITTYEMLMKDRAYLAAYKWGFIVVDEGHRLKNMDCKLMQEIKQLSSDGRMVLTGTPLHNNLAELWSLLNFVLPDIFSDLYTFQDWFNLPAMQASASSARSSRVISSLHTILRPFLLRRLKVDVETNLPPKKEYVLYAPLSQRQREVYDAIVQGGLRALLLRERGVKPTVEAEPPEAKVDEDEELNRRTRSKKKNGRPAKKEKRYDVDGDDDEYFERLESGELEAREEKERLERTHQSGQEWQYRTQLKKVNNMKLQNTVMQLRKVCSHPFLFDWPIDPDSMQPILNEELSSASGKMMVLDRLLTELFKRKHKVLLFSQFTTMLDIIQDWATEFKGWTLCRIDGSTSMADRRDAVDLFQNGGDDPDAPRLFILSTRAGGLGLNLVAADTVIFYDQDWNPQMDLQAQDRAHRIGQTKPVLIFRLVTAHTIETKIMQRATEKRKLEALVIAKGKFKTPTASVTRQSRPETMAEMAASLLKLEGEKIQVVPDTAAGKASVISDKDLDMLLDRRPEVFVDRGKGWTSAQAEKEGDAPGEKAAFAVYEAPANEGNDALADMMGEAIHN
ncbi:SNF2-family ATP dependent chromatin remodeling factor snf21 [Cristinia sonorae]|uniref:SNF2-family ATP dependent chromatin remodeling factor snf21 n=1 Tax=Cristinia sonorae TaxID=1940300 RepID=A0A8K0UUZ0_9AGAR|nr:SNF2-family ATP dependent chromatin remodeling factor snf21 [Cristinia sonorae]